MNCVLPALMITQFVMIVLQDKLLLDMLIIRSGLQVLCIVNRLPHHQTTTFSMLQQDHSKDVKPTQMQTAWSAQRLTHAQRVSPHWFPYQEYVLTLQEAHLAEAQK
jgi:hypothetical protein